jgi:anti-anti-sigma regulatory factor
MLNIHVDRVGEVTVVECEGRIVSSAAAFELRNAVTRQTDARVVILDFSELEALGGGAVGMLAFLQRWASQHHIRLKLFNPSRALLERLENTTSIPAFEFATIDEVIAYLSRAGSSAGMVYSDQGAAAQGRHG